MDHEKMYQYFESYRPRSSPQEAHTRSRSMVIPTIKPRICCECGAEECPYCGRSPSPPSQKRGFYPEFMERDYKDLSKSTTHEDFRSYGNKKDLEILFGFPAGRANPDEVYYDRSPNNKKSKDRRTYSNIERYKEASPIMKRGLQSHISDILGYEDSTESVEEDSPKKEKDIWAQGLPPGIYRSLSSKSPASMSPQPQSKKQVPWQRISKKDLEIARTQKKKPKRRGDSPQKRRSLQGKSIKETMDTRDIREIREPRGNEGQKQGVTWQNKDVTQTAVAQFQDKVKQASMLLRKSNSEAPMNRDSNHDYSTACKSMNEFSVHTYVDNDYVSFNKRDDRAALIERIKAKEEEKERERRVITPTRIHKASSEIGTKTSVEENAQAQGDPLMSDIFKRYGNQNRGTSAKERQSKEASNASSKRGSSVFNEPGSNQNQANLNTSAPDFKNTFSNEKMSKSEILSQKIDNIIKKDSFRSNQDEFGSGPSKSAILSQQVSMLREISQALLKRGNSGDEFQSQGNSSNAEQPYYPSTGGAFQREHGYFGDTGKTFKTSEAQSYPSHHSYSEEDDLVEQRSASIKAGSRKSLGKESSVVEFFPGDELSGKNALNPFMNPRSATSQQGENQEYPGSRYVVSGPGSFQKLKSQDQVASRSSIADSQGEKRKPAVGSWENLSQNSESKRSFKAESQGGNYRKGSQLQRETLSDEEQKNFTEGSDKSKPESNQLEGSVIINKTLRSSDFRKQMSQDVSFEGNPNLSKTSSFKEESQVLHDRAQSLKESIRSQRPSRKDSALSDKVTNPQEKDSHVEENFDQGSQIRRDLASKISRNPTAEYDQQGSDSKIQGSFSKNQEGKRTTPPLSQSQQGNPKKVDSLEGTQIKKSPSFNESVISKEAAGEKGSHIEENFDQGSQIRRDLASKISRNPTAEYDQQESNSFIQNQGGKGTTSSLHQSLQKGNSKKSNDFEESKIEKLPSFNETVTPKTVSGEQDNRVQGDFYENSQIRNQIASKMSRNTTAEYDQQEKEIPGSISKTPEGKKVVSPLSQSQQDNPKKTDVQFKKSSSLDVTVPKKESSDEKDTRSEGGFYDHSQIRKNLASQMSRNTPPVQSSSDASVPVESGQQERNLVIQDSKNQDLKKTTPPLYQSLQQGQPKKTGEVQFKKSTSLDHTGISKAVSGQDRYEEENFYENSQIRDDIASKIRRNTEPVQGSSDVSSPVEFYQQEGTTVIQGSISKNQEGKKATPSLHQSLQKGSSKKSQDFEESKIEKSPSFDETVNPKAVSGDQTRKEIASKISRNTTAEYDQQESNSNIQDSGSKAVSPLPQSQQGNPQKTDVQLKKSSSLNVSVPKKPSSDEKDAPIGDSFYVNSQIRNQMASKVSKNTLPVQSSSDVASPAEYYQQGDSSFADEQELVSPLSQSLKRQRTDVLGRLQTLKSVSLDESMVLKAMHGEKEPQTKKEIASNNSGNESPAEDDQVGTCTVLQGSIVKEGKKTTPPQSVQQIPQGNQRKSNVFEESPTKKSSSFNQTATFNASQSSSSKQQNEQQKLVSVQENLEKVSSNFIKQIFSIGSQNFSKQSSIDKMPVSSNESSIIKPKRINSWTDRSKDSMNSLPTEPNQVVEEVKSPVETSVVTKVQQQKPQLPPRTTEKPQEIEDLLEVQRYLYEKGNSDRPRSARDLLSQEAGNESHSEEKSGSYEFSFEENSHDKGDQRKANNETAKPRKDSGKVIVKNEEILVRQKTGDHSKSAVQKPSQEEKPSQKPLPTSMNRPRVEESQPKYNQGSLAVPKQDTSVSEDVKVDTERDMKNINNLKPKNQRYFDQPNQSGTELINKQSISIETKPAVATREEPKRNYLVEYFDVKVVYKDDPRHNMLQNFLSGKPVVTTQVSQGSLNRKDLFRYAK